MAAMVIAFTGIRDVDKASEAIIEVAAQSVALTQELRFGGARGSDSIALEAVCNAPARKVVYVPNRLADQPKAARRVIERCATHVVELRLGRHKRTYLQRNDAMIDGADRVIAFTDGRRHGGTFYTMRSAAQSGIPVSAVCVGSKRKPNPELFGDFSRPVYGVFPYVSARGGETDWVSETVRALKRGSASPQHVSELGLGVADYINREPVLASADAIALMPRRDPWAPNDLVPLGEEVARLTGKPLMRRLIRRRERPKDGVLRAFRMRFTPDEHAATFDVAPMEPARSVIVIDNVITTGASIEGAMRAIMDQTWIEPVGLGITYSTELGLETVA